MATHVIRTCNICGEPFNEFDEEQDFSIVKEIGYGSVHDGKTLELDICCKCMDKLIDKCVESPLLDDSAAVDYNTNFKWQ